MAFDGLGLCCWRPEVEGKATVCTLDTDRNLASCRVQNLSKPPFFCMPGIFWYKE